MEAGKNYKSFFRQREILDAIRVHLDLSANFLARMGSSDILTADDLDTLQVPMHLECFNLKNIESCIRWFYIKYPLFRAPHG